LPTLRIDLRSLGSMDIQLIDREPHALQQPVAVDIIRAMCVRAFGSSTAIHAIHELGTGSINNTYLLTIHGLPKVILRIAPAHDHPQAFMDEGLLLHHEYHMQPFFAPVATLTPQTLMADFTHQLLDRDYLFQTYIPGTPWSELHDRLTPEHQTALYRELGTIVRQIHAVTGSAFGDVRRSFPTWSQTIITRLEWVVTILQRYQLDTRDVTAVLATARAHANILDAITKPRLLHGDLWHQNLLVQWIAGGPRIGGVIDMGFASWGDPPFDWTLIRLALRPPAESASFWDTYGQLDQSQDAQFRAAIYHVQSLGVSLVETLRLKQTEGHGWVQHKLHDIAMQLQTTYG
jgi:aminoglycoside phosphotransferase (APT) family kinase protein